MTRAARRLLAVIGLVGTLLGVGTVPAVAATDVSISGASSQGGALTGVLSFRAPEVMDVDPGSIEARVDGEERPATVSGTTSIMRTSMLVIDTSGSMGVEGMATVRSATRTYLDEAPKDVRVGVATFADTAGIDLAPTRDREQVQRVVDGLAARGDTSLYAGVLAAAKGLGGEGDRSIVLLSDGADTISADGGTDLQQATTALADRGIRVDVVRFNTDDPEARSALEGFARAGGGSMIAADDANGVADAFQTAARALKSQAEFTITIPEELTGSHEVELEGEAGGSPFAVHQTVNLGGAGSAEPAIAEEGEAVAGGVAVDPVEPAGFSVWPWAGALAIGTAVFVLAFGALTPTVQTRRERRIAAIDSYVLAPGGVPGGTEARDARSLSERLVDFGERRMEGRRSTARTMQLIARADLPLRAGEWFVLCGVAVVVMVALAMLLLPGARVVGAILGLVVGLALPQLVLRFLAARRAKAFEQVLPQSLVLVATSLRSGFGLMQSLDAVAKDSAAPVDKEFSRALAETRIGTDIADALERMAERMGSESMHMAVMAIRIQREVGGNLAETMETTARTLRERETLTRQVAALSAEGRLSAQILIGLPIVLLLYMLVVNREYVQLLWTTGLGVLMSAGAIVLMVIGIFWMRRVVRIEV